MPEAVDLGYCMKLPPKKAIEYLRSKGYEITWDWEELWQDAQAKAFTVAKVTRLDILQDIRNAVETAISGHARINPPATPVRCGVPLPSSLMKS